MAAHVWFLPRECICLIINVFVHGERKILKKLQKKMPKILQVLKNVLPLHSLNETHGASVEKNAEIAQLVEHNLAKVGVASSSLVFRSL